MAPKMAIHALAIRVLFYPCPKLMKMHSITFIPFYFCTGIQNAHYTLEQFLTLDEVVKLNSDFKHYYCGKIKFKGPTSAWFTPNG